MDYRLEELLPVVAELTAQYTSKESTSVPYAIAEQLMGAVIYCIEEFEQCKDFKAAATVVNLSEPTISAKTAYEYGRQLVMDKVCMAQELYHAILPEFHDYGNRAYHETIIEGMPQFFLKYDFRFCPQDHLLTLDYPILMHFPQDMNGIDLINAYLQAVSLEQEFLKKIPEDYINFLTSSCPFEFAEAFVNIPAIVVKNMLGCKFAERRICMCSYTKQEIMKLKATIAREQKTGMLEQFILQEFSQILLQFPDVDAETADYLKLFIPDFCVELENALGNECLDKILILT